MWAFAGWACLAGSVLLAGIVHRGAREGRWVPWALLAAFGSAVAGWSLLGRSAPRPEPGRGGWVPWEEEESLGAAIVLAALVSAIVALRAALALRRAERAGDPAARERHRITLAGAGILLLSCGAMITLVSGFFICRQIAGLGPRLTKKDLDLLLSRFWSPVVVVPLLLGLLATAFGVFHLAPAATTGKDHGTRGSP